MAKTTMTKKVAFQGKPGAYSELACIEVFPGLDRNPCEFFEDTFEALVHDDEVDVALLPVENSCGGTIHDVYLLLPKHGLHIVGEFSLKVNHCLLATDETEMSDVKIALSHKQALAQCKKYLRRKGIEAKEYSDTAGAAELLAEQRPTDTAAIASSKAAEIYGLKILDCNIQDIRDNYTRFVALSQTPAPPPENSTNAKTTILFACKDGAGGLLELLSVFHAQGIIMEKIEPQPNPDVPLVDSSNGRVYGRSFNYLFVVDFVGSTSDPRYRTALDYLAAHSDFYRVLGSYLKHKF